MQNIAVIFAIFTWIFCIWSFFLYDRLAIWSYKNDRDLWNKLGKPRGLMRRIPPQKSNATNFQESFKVLFLVIRRVDTFALDEQTKKQLFRLRLITVLAFTSGLIGFAFAWNIPH